jgi:exodeoxyribonuclease VII small subunit
VTGKNNAEVPKEATFEEAMRELETIVARMDDGSLTLEESLAAYKRGAELVRRCQEALEAVREQVQILDGEMLKPAGELFAERSADAG